MKACHQPLPYGDAEEEEEEEKEKEVEEDEVNESLVTAYDDDTLD